MPNDRSEPPLPSLILGTMARQGDDPGARLAIYEAALARGLNTFDTAPLYGFGAAETILGRLLASRPREDLRILGKVGLRWGPEARGEILFTGTDAEGEPMIVRRDSRPEAVVDDVNRSLERLGTDYLDLVQIHQPDPRTPIDETMGALRELRRAGKVREVGVSNFDGDQLDAARHALGDVPLFSLQAEYSLLQRRVEPVLLPRCAREGIAMLAYSPLAAGRLARMNENGDSGGSLGRAMRDVLLPLARRHGVRPAAIALRWLMQQPGTSAITGVSTPAQLEEQAAALEVHLTRSEIDALAQGFRRAARREAFRASGGLRGVARRRIGAVLRRLGMSPSGLRRAARRAGA